MADAPVRQGSGAIQILVATAIGGGAGYALTVFAGVRLGAAAYAPFAVYWSALYLLISAVSGVQQEVTRATATASGAQGVKRSVARNFAIGAAVILFAIIGATSPLWSGVVFGDEHGFLVWPLAVGISAYAVVAVVAGVLYGLQIWRYAALLVIVDGMMRLVLVVAALLITNDMALISWTISIPFALAPLIVWPLARCRVVGRFRLDVGYRSLTWNVARTVVAAAATGVLISGFPLLLGATSNHDPASEVAAIVFASNLTRAPIVVVVLSLQSYLIVRFRTRGAAARKEVGAVLAVIIAAAALASSIAWLYGEAVFRAVFGAEFVLEPTVLALLVGSAAVVAALCATGPYVLSMGRHTLFTCGWVAAAIGTVIPLLLPFDLTTRALLALWVGPAVGLLIHLGGVAFRPTTAVPSPT